MKKFIALIILTTTVLSGCAVKPITYNYEYDEKASFLYIDSKYVAPVPSVLINHEGNSRANYGSGYKSYR